MAINVGPVSIIEPTHSTFLRAIIHASDFENFQVLDSIS
ncbi:hypothetical protein BSU04_26270 [Caballeronia sordidicola]|uniref:Uncharacterized protein n=1 Tax=Caballeronia sordidicola TaxID=196367 RepID=A0A226WX30_CABSO|nr:hypothetical protein BSU04_26270 [Caballeronia sordidicola]